MYDVSDRVDTLDSEVAAHDTQIAGEHARSLRLAALLFRKGLLTKAELEEWEWGADAPVDRIGSSGASPARGSLAAGYGSFDRIEDLHAPGETTVRLRAKSSDVRSRGGTRDWKDESEESESRGGSEEQNM